MRWKVVSVLLLVLAGLGAFLWWKYIRPTAGGVPTNPAGEPDKYTARVVTTVGSGQDGKIVEGRIARLGELFREDWTQDGENRACIWRPDLNKVFMLYPDRLLYMESPIEPSLIFDGQERDSREERNRQAGDGVDLVQEFATRVNPQSIEALFDSAEPLNTESRELPPEVIGGQICGVVEQRLTLSTGTVQLIKTFRAKHLDGLAIRTEVADESGGGATVIELRDVTLEVSEHVFSIPAGFSRVEKPPSR